jgi:hypothetical protein
VSLVFTSEKKNDFKCNHFQHNFRPSYLEQPNESSATKEEVIQMLVSINESLCGIQSSCELTNFNILLIYLFVYDFFIVFTYIWV